MNFYLGVHEPAWLPRSDVRLFVSHRRLRRRVKMPVARSPWALDSGGFSELSMYGSWRTTATEYAQAAQTYATDVGLLDWAAPMDWMCEPFMLDRTGRTITWHQGATTESIFELRALAPEVRWVPVLQGWGIGDYVDHLRQYDKAGMDLRDEDTVGVGSVCRRQSTKEIEDIFVELRGCGLRCHGFGVKTQGLKRYARHLTSADSMAWSFDARYGEPIPGHTHAKCQNCWVYARRWHDRLLAQVEGIQ